MSIRYRNEDERLIAEQAIAAFREAQKAMLGAPHGHGLAVTEEAVLSQGRKFIASMIQQLMSATPSAKRGACSRRCKCGRSAAFKYYSRQS